MDTFSYTYSERLEIEHINCIVVAID
jgi:hypothetical protein